MPHTLTFDVYDPAFNTAPRHEIARVLRAVAAHLITDSGIEGDVKLPGYRGDHGEVIGRWKLGWEEPAGDDSETEPPDTQALYQALLRADSIATTLTRNNQLLSFAGELHQVLMELTPRERAAMTRGTVDVMVRQVTGKYMFLVGTQVTALHNLISGKDNH